MSKDQIKRHAQQKRVLLSGLFKSLKTAGDFLSFPLVSAVVFVVVNVYFTFDLRNSLYFVMIGLSYRKGNRLRNAGDIQAHCSIVPALDIGAAAKWFEKFSKGTWRYGSCEGMS